MRRKRIRRVAGLSSEHTVSQSPCVNLKTKRTDEAGERDAGLRETVRERHEFGGRHDVDQDHDGRVSAGVREVAQCAEDDHAEEDEAVLSFDRDEPSQLGEEEVDGDVEEET